MSVLPGCFANSEGRKSGNPTAENYFKINLNFWSLSISDRERLKRKMSTILSSTVDHGNFVKKSSKTDPSDAGDMWAVELQSLNE